MKLDWKPGPGGEEAFLGDFAGECGVRFSTLYLPTCYRRGKWRLLIEVEDHTHAWGCFDHQDEPMRYYHSEVRMKEEAQAIADVLVADYEKKLAQQQQEE